MRSLLSFIIALAAVAYADERAEFFELRVRPVLAKNCYACHTTTKMGGLTLDTREGLMKGGQSGPVVRAGDPDNSLLIQAVRHSHDRLKMPPTGKLAEAEIADLGAWVRDGAFWPEAATPAGDAGTNGRITDAQRAWWAFQPVRKPAPPRVKNSAWARTAIDRFILARLEEKGLRPVEPADRRTWLRRATYDLTGLPPTPEEMDAFLNNRSSSAQGQAAQAQAIDRLLASPRYGERWARHWLDTARYSDDRLNSTQDDPQPNVWRYRDWVIQALNQDMPYDRFLKAQIAGDLMPDKDRYIAGLGFFANSPQFQDDRVDALSRGFMALTAACAQCHDHKFDPIPTRDYYSLLGVFENTKAGKHPLVAKNVVDEFERRTKANEEAQKAVAAFEEAQAAQLAEILANDAARYLQASRSGPSKDLDAEALTRWTEYLDSPHQHPFLKNWREARFDDQAFQRKLLAVIAEKKEIDRENLIRLGGKDDNRTVRVIEVKSLARDDYMLWKELVSGERTGKRESGILYYKGPKLDRFMAPHWKQHLDHLRAARDLRKREIPEMYPYVMTIEDVEKPKDIRVRIRGDRQNLGEEAPRQFLRVLSNGEPKRFTTGSGRLELAGAVADPANPLTARVVVNRIWMHHFGRAIVATPGNFGRLGEPPTHPELLDYLAARLVEQGWSLKALHREIMLSAVYGLSAGSVARNASPGKRAQRTAAAPPRPVRFDDADNTLYWRANRRRLDVEPMRDTLLFVSGELDEKRGGEAVKLTSPDNKRRTVYGFVSRRSLDRTLGLFDFPNPMATSDRRIPTATPLQQLFFLNSTFVQDRARALARRVEKAGDDRARITAAYRILFQRAPEAEEVRLGLEYLAASSKAGAEGAASGKAGAEGAASGKAAWPRYAQALLGSNALVFVE